MDLPPLTLPALTTTHATPASADSNPYSPRDARVLLVDGSARGRWLMARIVRRSFRAVDPVVESANLASVQHLLGSAEGPSQAAWPQLRLVLTEWELPDGHFSDLLTQLGQHPCLKVVFTLRRNEADALEALRSGADGYLLKQEPRAVLVRDLQRLGQGQPALSSWVSHRLIAHLRKAPRTSGMDAPVHARPPDIAPADVLTARETEVLMFLSKGLTIREMAAVMRIRWFTVNDHIKSIYRKLGVCSRAEAAVIAARQGLV